MSLYLFFFGLLVILFYGVCYIIVLLGIEMMLLGVYVFLCFSFLMMSSVKGVLFFLVVMVCMGGFGVSLLIAVSRGYGRGGWLFYPLY